MDGCFVPNLSYGEKVIATVNAITSMPLDVHLMVVEPEKYLERFADAGADTLTIHAEATPHLQRHLVRIRELGCRAGVALNPSTPLSAVSDLLADIDLLLVMTVNPGFGGQPFIPHSLDKVRRARAVLADARSAAALEVDGGISLTTIASVWSAGADTFVAGNSIFGAPDPGSAIRALRTACSIHV